MIFKEERIFHQESQERKKHGVREALLHDDHENSICNLVQNNSQKEQRDCAVYNSRLSEKQELPEIAR